MTSATQYQTGYVHPAYQSGNQWNGSAANGKLGSFSFKYQEEYKSPDVAKVIDISVVYFWGDYTDHNRIYCKICERGPLAGSYEVELEWGDTKKFEYISDVCSRCMNLINQNIVRNGDPNKPY